MEIKCFREFLAHFALLHVKLKISIAYVYRKKLKILDKTQKNFFFHRSDNMMIKALSFLKKKKSIRQFLSQVYRSYLCTLSVLFCVIYMLGVQNQNMKMFFDISGSGVAQCGQSRYFVQWRNGVHKIRPFLAF